MKFELSTILLKSNVNVNILLSLKYYSYIMKFLLFDCIGEANNFSIFNRHFQSYYYQFINPFEYLAISHSAVVPLLKTILMLLYKIFQKIHFINVVLIFSERVHSSKLFKLMNIIKYNIILKNEKKKDSLIKLVSSCSLF